MILSKLEIITIVVFGMAIGAWLEYFWVRIVQHW